MDPDQKKRNICGAMAPVLQQQRLLTMAMSSSLNIPNPSMRMMSLIIVRYTTKPFLHSTSSPSTPRLTLLLMLGTSMMMRLVMEASQLSRSISMGTPSINATPMEHRSAPKGCACIQPSSSTIPMAIGLSASVALC